MITVDVSKIISPQQIARQIARSVADAGVDSLPEYTSSTRLTPMVLIDRDITFLTDDVQQDLLQTMCSIYAAHYMQALAVSMNVQGINTIALLDQFATDRQPLRNTARSIANNVDFQSADDLASFGFEAADNYADKQLQEHVNLAIGRLLHVKIGFDSKTVTIPVSLVLNPKVVNSDAIPKVLAMTTADTSMSARYHKWKAGEIESFLDYVFGLDLIEQDRKALLSDDSGLYKIARERRYRSLIDLVASGGAKSYNTASTMSIITKAASEELELALKGRLKDVKTRNEYFKTTHSMMLVVVDPRMERLTIYQRGIAEFGQYTFNDIKRHGSNAGAMDITSILKAYKLGEAPSL